MLLKRLDVTIQSFLWSDRAKVFFGGHFSLIALIPAPNTAFAHILHPPPTFHCYLFYFKAMTDEIERIYQPQRAAIKVNSTIEAKDILFASRDLTRIEKTSNSGVRQSTHIAKLVIGAVCLRGGGGVEGVPLLISNSPPQGS